jgi:large subunit ribosomal protein L10
MQEETKKPISRVKKEETVKQLVEKFSRAKSVVLTDNSGLTVAAQSELKNKLRGVDAEMVVAKNTLLKLASIKTGHQVPDEVLNGPTAALFAYSDEIGPIKELTNFAKTNERPVIKLGFLGTSLLTTERVNSLAKLPSKDVLRGNLVGSLSSPLYGVMGVLSANIRNLVYTINAIKEQKSNF